MWSQGIFGNPVDPAGSVFANRCHMTTAKAMLVNVAAQYDWTLGGPNGDIDRFKQGWGLPHVGTLYELRDHFSVLIDETDLGGQPDPQRRRRQWRSGAGPR
jgi:serine protease AprX